MEISPSVVQPSLKEAPSRGHLLALAAFFISLGLVLLTVVEMRRAFWLPLSSYSTIGGPSVILYFNLIHLPLLAVGFLGALLSFRYLASLEKGLKETGVDLSGLTRLLGLGLLALFMADLFIYRGVPASRIAAAGKTSVGQAIPMDAFAGWLRPLGEGLNYMALVWHATLVGILIGSLFLVLVVGILRKWVGGTGFKSHLAGTILALGQPFCSCCAAPIGAALYRGGASLGTTLAFVVSSPMLNITSLVLAISLLPAQFAVLRIGGGLVIGILVTYLVSVMASGWSKETTAVGEPGKLVEASSGLLNAFSRLFQFETSLSGATPDSPAAFITTWLGAAWRLGRVVVPVLFLGAVLTSAVVTLLPAPSNGVLGIMGASLFGTLLMVPTWTELAIAPSLIREGLTGPAAALLITLPAVSIPCLIILGAATRNYRAALLLGGLVFGVGIMAGLWFPVA